jgi:hypothetical protein
MTPEEAGMQATAQLGCIQQQQEICQTETAVEVETTIGRDARKLVTARASMKKVRL